MSRQVGGHALQYLQQPRGIKAAAAVSWTLGVKTQISCSKPAVHFSKTQKVSKSLLCCDSLWALKANERRR